jgi:hypothetical protein
MENELLVRVQSLEDKTTLEPVKWNKAEVQANLDAMLDAYKGRVYTEDEIKSAKDDRAKVNKIEEQLETAEKAVKAYYAAPVTEFGSAIKALRAQCKAVSGAIDKQIKAVENAAKEEKRKQIEEVYEGHIGDDLRPLVPFDRLMNAQWLNKTYALSTAIKELLTKIETCREELAQLRTLCEQDEYPSCERAYLNALSIREALAERQRLQTVKEQQARAEEARRAAEKARQAAPILQRPTQQEIEIRNEAVKRAQANQIINENGQLDFSALQQEQPKTFRRTLEIEYTAEQGRALVDFLKSSGIRYTLH